MSLNQALVKIDEAYIKLAQASMDVYTERFTELVHNDEFCVELKRVPYKILEVTYCGFSMPENSYQWSNKRITLNDAFCFEDGNELVVMYQAKFSGGC
jgi:hypothetical protein